MTTQKPDILCAVCGRVKWGEWIYLGPEKGRHEECGLGSEAWREYYMGLSPEQQEPLRQFYLYTYKPKQEGRTDEEQ